MKIYHALPAPLRSLAASWHGYRLRRWRYGEETDRLAAQARERESWTPAQWRRWESEQLTRLLHRAATRVPYYRQHWRERSQRGDKASFEILENWPVLQKETLRRDAAAFVADDCDKSKMVCEHTSGTTGTPVDLWQSRDTTRAWYALYEARTRGWCGVGRHDRWGIVGAQRVVPLETKSPPFWVWNAGLNQLYLSALHVAPWSAVAYLDAIKKYRLKYLLGYTNSLVFLAQAALETKAKFQLTVVITNGEEVTTRQRKIMEAGFGSPVRETYGMSEVAAAAGECEAGAMHLWPDVGHVEILDDDYRPVPAGSPGRIVTTGLLNFDMPLIRYDTRDIASLPANPKPCACGRTLPMLVDLMGRADDVLVTKDGRRLVQIDGIFGSDLHIKEGQIVQKSYDDYCVRVVPSAGWNQNDAAKLRADLQQRVGDAEVTVEVVEHIERTWAGKFRIIISEIKK